MIKGICILALSCFLAAAPARAYEFTKIDMLFDTLLANYDGVFDIKQLSLFGGRALHKVDNSLRLYNSDSKAYLYEKNNLIATFKLPQDENPLLWKQLLADILKTGAARSLKLSDNPNTLETEVLSEITANLDEYSRLEKNNQTADLINYRLIDGILYISPTTFYKGFSDYFTQIISRHPSLKGVILDLRNNHGGDFNEAIKTADLFLDNTLIAYRAGKNQPKRYYISTNGDILRGKPLAVLTNEETASSAEIVAAALYEQSRATLIGTKTYGKDSTQLVNRMDTHTLFLTNGYFYTPSGKRISETGILPQICTGIGESCTITDKNDPNKDIVTAINLIKKNLG